MAEPKMSTDTFDVSRTVNVILTYDMEGGERLPISALRFRHKGCLEALAEELGYLLNRLKPHLLPEIDLLDTAFE